MKGLTGHHGVTAVAEYEAKNANISEIKCHCTVTGCCSILERNAKFDGNHFNGSSTCHSVVRFDGR